MAETGAMRECCVCSKPGVVTADNGYAYCETHKFSDPKDEAKADAIAKGQVKDGLAICFFCPKPGVFFAIQRDSSVGPWFCADHPPNPAHFLTGGPVYRGLPAEPLRDTKPTNPKDQLGFRRLPLRLVPPTALALASLAHLQGALKYGPYNWREAGVRVSVYIDAALRHILKYHDGEDIDSDSGLPHLAHALACLNIIVDAEACGKLTDDRPPPAPLEEWFAALTPHVERLQTQYKRNGVPHAQAGQAPAGP